MNIHLVTQDYKSDQILARLARTLIEGLGWTADAEPDPLADVNYAFPYLYLSEPYTKTYTAGWFTHKDEMHSAGKAKLWEQIAGSVNLRTTSAVIYKNSLSQFGKTVHIMPPVDMEKFQPARRSRRSCFIVGTSGQVYPGGRKGENLMRALAEDTHFTKTVEFRAAGAGWPVKTKRYPWETLQTFYQDLDVYVCTSLIEGVGYGPLEAMACGVPVVVPAGVGVFDELGEREGIYRYPAGDYPSLARALQGALQDAPYLNMERIRANVGAFTLDGWLQDHERAMNALIEKSLPAVEKTDWRGRAGVYYVAYGKPARDCAEIAITSWKAYMPDVPVALASPEPLGLEDICIPAPDSDIGARSVKTQIYDLTPQDWEFVLYLDADTELTAPVPFLFDALADGWELVICKNPDKYHTTRRMHRPDNLEECQLTIDLLGYDDLIQWNGGVFGFRRNDRVRAFFQAWHTEWERWGARDQQALLRAMWQYPLRVLTLGNEWNTVTRYLSPDTTAGILHYPTTARRWTGRVDGRLDSRSAWSKVKD